MFSLRNDMLAFNEIPLNHKSLHLCTIATPFGGRQTLRLLFGICSAPEIYQETVGNILQDVQTVIIYFDDVLILPKNMEEHNEVL